MEGNIYFAETDGVAYNTITPIARMHDDVYEMDLVLRNNITTEESPWVCIIQQKNTIILRKRILA